VGVKGRELLFPFPLGWELGEHEKSFIKIKIDSRAAAPIPPSSVLWPFE
jgi:hypothetical protein